MAIPEEKKDQQEPKDSQLDAPSVANTEKHINFREEAEKDSQNVLRVDTENDEDERRREQWQEGIEAGKEQRKEEGD